MTNPKNLIFLLIIISMFILQGCGNIDDGSFDPDATDFQTETPDDDENGGVVDESEAEVPPDSSGSTDDNSKEKVPPDSSGNTEVSSDDEESGSPGIGSAEECIDLALASTAVDIGGGLPDEPSRYEPSGADWHSRLNKLFSVHDNGAVFMMDKDGSDITTWWIGGDLEGITVPDPESDFVYIGREYPAAILEFNIETDTVTRTFDLTAWMTGSSQGLEALTFVEIDGHPEGGEFWAGHQGEGKIYVFDLPIASSSTSTAVDYIGTHKPVSSRGDMSGLDYSAMYDVVYVIYDFSNKLTIVDTDGISIVDKNLPQRDQEGIAVNDLCDVFIAQDTNKKVWFYEGLEEGVAIDGDVVQLLASRIAAVQNDDGSYDWKSHILDPLTPEVTGYQNVTGVSVWGLFGAGDYLGSENYRDAILNSVNYFDDRIDTLLADPSDVNGKLSCPNYTVLAWYLQANPDAILEGRVVSALGATLDARDDDYGSDPAMRVDGMFNYMISRRANIPGVIPWDMGLCVEAFKTISQISDDFSDDYTDSLALLADYLENSFLPTYDADTTIIYGDISLGMPLFVLAASQLSDSHADLIDGLTTRLEDLVDVNGMITNGSENGDGLEQPSAYGLLALKQIGSDLAQNVQDYLESSVDDRGRIYDPATFMETYEVEGEVLRALTVR